MNKKEREFFEKKHKEIWNFIDSFAITRNISTSKLAKTINIDATAFNKSKRVYGSCYKGYKEKLRFPCISTIAKLLIKYNMSWEEFGKLVDRESKKWR